jgi:hypothetical protein
MKQPHKAARPYTRRELLGSAQAATTVAAFSPDQITGGLA